MKFLLVVMSFLVFSVVHAQEVSGCAGGYAAGLGHLMKGESISFAETEMIQVGKTVSDEFFKAKVVSLNGETKVELTNLKTNKKENLTSSGDNNGMTIYTTSNLVNSRAYPAGVPGAFAGKIFLIFICVK